jgi:DNA-binding transcriptional LysR family regulator
VIRFVLCAAPSYLDRRRPPTHFGRGKLGATVKVPRSFASNSYMVLRTAALKGLGIALLPFRIAREDVQNGTLVELRKGHPIPDRPLYAAFAPGGAPEKVQALVSYLGAWFRNHPSSQASG